MSNASLLPLPAGVRLLTDREGEMLNTLHPGLPRSLADCITCKGSKTFRWYDINREPVEYECNCVDQRILHRYLLYSGLRKHYQRLAWSDLDVGAIDQSVLRTVMEYLEGAPFNVDSGRGLVLHSPKRGTGKTMLAALLFKALLAQGIGGHFVQFNEMLDSFTGTWRDPEARTWFTQRVTNIGVLVIDDVGRENKARVEVAEAMFDMVLRSRHDDDKPTIITTNKTPEEFEVFYRSNILSLLSGTSSWLQVDGSDWRERNNQRVETERSLGLTRPLVVG